METTKKGFRLLEQANIEFVGNVESKDLFLGRVDVAVCDGFVGNVVPKTTEVCCKHMISSWLKELFQRNPIRILGHLFSRGCL